MKIKCPVYIWCNVEVETEKDLGNHLFSKHKHDELSWTLAEKIFKIHEKIEHWEGHGISLSLDSNDVVDVLKSLLEDEKRNE